MKKFIFALCLWVASTSLTWGQTVICWDRNITTVQQAFSTRAVAESWYPKYVKLSDNSVAWGESMTRWYAPVKNLGDGFPKWESVEEGHRWKWKYVRGSNTLQVFLSSSTAYKDKPPLIYKKCQLTQGISNTSNAASGREAFRRLSTCNKKYVQQFLKGQGFYTGVIDGIWGNGTKNAITKIGRIGKLKGLSNESIIEKLQENLVCG